MKRALSVLCGLVLLAGASWAQTPSWRVGELAAEMSEADHKAAEALAQRTLRCGELSESAYEGSAELRGPAAAAIGRRPPLRASVGPQAPPPAQEASPATRAYADLAGAVARSAEEFRRDNIAGANERDSLADDPCP